MNVPPTETIPYQTRGRREFSFFYLLVPAPHAATETLTLSFIPLHLQPDQISYAPPPPTRSPAPPFISSPSLSSPPPDPISGLWAPAPCCRRSCSGTGSGASHHCLHARTRVVPRRPPPPPTGISSLLVPLAMVERVLGCPDRGARLQTTPPPDPFPSYRRLLPGNGRSPARLHRRCRPRRPTSDHRQSPHADRITAPLSSLSSPSLSVSLV